MLAVDVAEAYHPPEHDNLIEIASHSLTIMSTRLKEHMTTGERFLLHPALPEEAGLLTFREMPACMEAGYEATRRQLPVLRPCSDEYAPRHGVFYIYTYIIRKRKERRLMDKNLLASDEVPMGLSMALAKNLEAMNAFTALPPEGKAAVIEKTHSVHSKKEMEQLVRDLGHNATM